MNIIDNNTLIYINFIKNSITNHSRTKLSNEIEAPILNICHHSANQTRKICPYSKRGKTIKHRSHHKVCVGIAQ